MNEENRVGSSNLMVVKHGKEFACMNLQGNYAMSWHKTEKKAQNAKNLTHAKMSVDKIVKPKHSNDVIKIQDFSQGE